MFLAKVTKEICKTRVLPQRLFLNITKLSTNTKQAHITVFCVVCDREQPVRLNTGLSPQLVEALIQTKQRQQLTAATFTFYSRTSSDDISAKY